MNMHQNLILMLKKQWNICNINIKALTPNQLLQRLITALAQVKAGNTSKTY